MRLLTNAGVIAGRAALIAISTGTSEEAAFVGVVVVLVAGVYLLTR